MTTEIYKDIEGYEGLYQVSDIGSVMRVNGGKGAKSGRILRPLVNTSGYHQVGLFNDGVKKRFRIHRLVALTFLPNPDSKKEVNHIDGVKTNNCISNLEWNTRKENMVHSSRVLGNKHGTRGEKNPQYGKFLGDNRNAVGVIQYDLDWNEIERYSSITGARLATGVAGCNITQACRGKQQTAGGYRWSYL